MKGFTASDFAEIMPNGFSMHPFPGRCAKIANAILEKRLSEAETVYGCPPDDNMFSSVKYGEDTHKAKLLAITPIGEKWNWEKKE